tara:strand:- start:872 stop:1039 length:168 start_codon:yes stop_codon:yes gene_type:complete
MVYVPGVKSQVNSKNRRRKMKIEFVGFNKKQKKQLKKKLSKDLKKLKREKKNEQN